MKIRIDINKNTKLTYYLQALTKFLIPKFYYRKKLISLFDTTPNIEHLYNRINYYNKLDSNFSILDTWKTIREFEKFAPKKVYYFDLLEYLRYYETHFKISYLFGDVIDVPEVPTLLKSRPIEGDNKNSVLMKLDKVRHFIFVNDKKKFEDKKNMLVWRGKAHQEHRQYFLDKFYSHPLCDVGQIFKENDINKDAIMWRKNKMSLAKQLDYKFILAIEGNDVASNLKWVMSSNSIAFMTKPKYETWFMEGTLIPNHHYVLLKDDYSDLEEKVLYYTSNIDASLQIIENAHRYIEEFKNQKNEDMISLLVLKKYFEQSQQL